MEYSYWLSIITGILLLIILGLDVFFAIFQNDKSGLYLGKLHLLIWRCLLSFAKRVPRYRRFIVSVAGSCMMVMTILIWLSLFILAFALIYWPHISTFRSAKPLSQLYFIDALYFSGTTGTVLGFGDITPLTNGMKVLSFIEAGLGFGLLTVVVTYILQVLSGAYERNAMALKLKAQYLRSEDGARSVLKHISIEGKDLTLEYMHSLNDKFQLLQEQMHQFPILDIYYRSIYKWRDPELLFLTLFEMAVALRMFVSTKEGLSLSLIADSLEVTLSELMITIENEHSLKNQEIHSDEESKNINQSFNKFKYIFEEFSILNHSNEEKTKELIKVYRSFLIRLNRLTDWLSEHSERKSPLLLP